MTAENLELITPGEILKTEFMEPMKMSANALARAIQVSPNRITEILHNRRSITADTALRLGTYFDMQPEFWLNLQAQYELKVAKRLIGSVLNTQIRPRVVSKTYESHF